MGRGSKGGSPRPQPGGAPLGAMCKLKVSISSLKTEALEGKEEGAPLSRGQRLGLDLPGARAAHPRNREGVPGACTYRRE